MCAMEIVHIYNFTRKKKQQNVANNARYGYVTDWIWKWNLRRNYRCFFVCGVFILLMVRTQLIFFLSFVILSCLSLVSFGSDS